MTKTKFNQSEIQRITGKSRTTIAKHLNNGKLSFELDDKGNKLVDWSELERTYGADDLNLENLEGRKAKKESRASTESGATVQLLTKLLDDERADRKSERERLNSNIDELQERLKEAHKISLIEDQRDEKEKAKEKSHIEDLQDHVTDLKKTVAEQGIEVKKKDNQIKMLKKEVKRLRLHNKKLENAGFFLWNKPKAPEQNEINEEETSKSKASKTQGQGT